MNRLKSFIAISAFSLLILGLPAIASAQWRNGNGGYYGNGRYNQNISGVVRNLKERSKQFEKAADRERRYSNNGRYGGYNGGNLEDLADRFKKATDRLEDSYGRGRNLDNSADEARRVLDIGSQIDQILYQSRGSYNLQNEWNQISNDLRVVADTYGYNYNNGYNRNNRNNRNNRGNRNGNWRDRVPFPLPF